jgi:hypothetical protein
LYVKGDLPVEGITPLTDSAWSASTYCADKVGADGAVSCEVTATFPEAPDVAVSGVVAPSLTFSSAEYVCPAVNAPPEVTHATVFPDACPVPEFAAHCVACA